MANNKLFVGGLSWNTDDAGLRAAFEVHGEVTDAKVVTDRETGRSRGFGFVSFADAADAQAAVQQMNGATVDGRTIAVNEARERGEGGGGGGGGRGGYGGGGGGDRRGGGGGGGDRRGGGGGGGGGWSGGGGGGDRGERGGDRDNRRGGGGGGGGRGERRDRDNW